MASASSTFAGAGEASVFDGPFCISRLSPCLFKLVEADPFGQAPFCFAIIGSDKVVVVDTGTGAAGASLREVLDRQLNPGRLPYVVICTHNHFDHVGGAAGFAGSEICMGKQNPTYSKNLEVTSLAAGVGARVKPFEVTRWLEDGDEVWLDDSDRSRFNRLSVHFTPGHALDHIAVFFERELRLFVGDTLYPFTAIDLANMGSNVPDYRATLGKIAALASRAETAGIPAAPAGTGAAHAAPKTVGDPPAAGKPAGSPGAAPQGPAGPAAAAPGPEAAKGAAVSEAASTAIAEVEAKASKVKQLLDEWLGIPEDEAAASFDPWGVMEACGWDVAAAATAIQDLGDAAGEIAPPGSYAMPTSTDEAGALLEGVLAGAVEPCTVSAEDATAEYRGESYAFVLPHPLPAPKGA
ncbi:hypothetical protein FNF31_01779 [Cafeteria roenbergensis]|uniref:Metallo-beta-lactamase domain-containing protein n=1 Tax=Cafeteria roenbergensis TaxID=33653 RepID=A0A5A8DKB3_CAFRO|nr:hypothetical protein FNF31_01779 [Cafeteria roenbergensis]